MNQESERAESSDGSGSGPAMSDRRAARVASLDRGIVGATSLWLNGESGTLPRRRTYVTLGLERGGTSAVAGIQRGLGLYLGDIDKGNNEDAAFTGYRLARIRKAVNRRNREHDVWGFKYPKAVMYMPQIIENLRNPFFIVVYRDAVATAISHLSWTGKKNRKPANMALHEANAFSNSNTSFVFSSGRPTLVISHELVMRKPDDAIDELARFLGAQPPSDELRRQIRGYIAPGSYKKFEDHFSEIPKLT